MNKAGWVPGPIDSLDELLAVATALERESAARYRALCAQMRLQGHVEMATQFESLASAEDRHAQEVADRSRTLLGHTPDPARVRWDLPADFDRDATSSAFASAYQALAFAVRNEERAFAFYAYVASETVRPEIRALAEDLARDELHHAALLRHHRRRAFHAERPRLVEIPPTVEALRIMSRRWDAEAAAAHAALVALLDEAGEVEDATIFRRLAAIEAAAAEGAAPSAVPALRGVADGLRLLEAAFDQYVLIAERAGDGLVLAEAQRLAGEMISRLALTGGNRRNALLGYQRGP